MQVSDGTRAGLNRTSKGDLFFNRIRKVLLKVTVFRRLASWCLIGGELTGRAPVSESFWSASPSCPRIPSTSC